MQQGRGYQPRAKDIMYLKKIAMSRIQDYDFIVYQAPFPNEDFPFRFQYSGMVENVSRSGRQFDLQNWTIEKFNRKGKHVRTTHEYNPGSQPLLCEFETGAVVFKVMMP